MEHGEPTADYAIVRSDLESEDILWSLVVEMNQRKIHDDIIKRFYQPVKKPEYIEPSVPTLTSRILPILQQYAAATGSRSIGQAVSVRDGATCLTKVHKLCERIVEQGRKGDVRWWKELLIQCYHLRRSRTFRAFLFSFQDGYELFRTIQKLGRYRIATQALIDAVRAHPVQFRNVDVQPVQPASYYDVNASIYPDADLRMYLRSILNAWRITAVSKENFEQIRGHFRERCAEMPVVHAEMQLVKYYEENPKAQQPTLIGCGKKPCQLCVRFLHLHGKFSVEKTHARISHRWAIPNMRCKNSEGVDKFQRILDTMSQEMEDSLREIINLGPEKKPKLQEVSTCSTFAAPQDVVPKNAGTRKLIDIQHKPSWDSGFVDSPSTSSLENRTAKDWDGNNSRNNSNPDTPPPLHRLYHPPPPIPSSPPPLRRRRCSPGSLNEEFKNQEHMTLRQKALGLLKKTHVSKPGNPVAVQPSPPPSSPPPHSLHRASSPTLGWHTRFPRHSIDSPQILHSLLAAPPTPPPDSDQEEEVVESPRAPIRVQKVYHLSNCGSSRSLDEIVEEPESPVRQSSSSVIFNIPFQDRSSRPRSVASDKSSSRCSLGDSGVLPPPLQPPRPIDLGDMNRVYTPPYQDMNEHERQTVDVEIVDTTKPKTPPILRTLKRTGRLPTPPNIPQSHKDPSRSPPMREVSPLVSPKTTTRPVRHTPPKNIPHIVISSLPKKPPEPLYSPETSYLSTTPPSSSSSSLNSTYTPSLSRRHNRLRLPPHGFSPSPPLTPPNPGQPSNASVLSTTSTSHHSFFTNTSNSTTNSQISSGTTSHIAIPVEYHNPLLDGNHNLHHQQQYNRHHHEHDYSKPSTKHHHRTSEHLPWKPPLDSGGVDHGGGEDRVQAGGGGTPSVKSFLLRAVNKHPHPAGGGESVSWISLDIAEDLLKGSDRFEVTAQLLDVDPGNRGGGRGRGGGWNGGGGGGLGGGGGWGGGNGLVLRHEYHKNEELLVLDIDFGGAILRMKIFW